MAYEARQVIRAEPVTIPAGTAALDGLYYEPEPSGAAARGAVQLMHGNGGNFYTGPCRFLPPHLLQLGLACLSYNRQGHDTIACRAREPGGNAFQTVAQSVDDNEHARRYLARREHPDPVVIGHSNGGLLAARYVAGHPGTPALVLLSAHCGGPEMLRRPASRAEPGLVCNHIICSNYIIGMAQGGMAAWAEPATGGRHGKAVPHRTSLGPHVAGRRGRAVPAQRR
ncbi:MAG TPA: alpha/beta hydrolase, partial [Streptosporangiaceae bacterium]|nr:alpha/beta hydrolase [Streptosporangiaceae bacterium]